MRRKELFYYVTSGSNVTRDVHWCVTVDYQQIANGNIANQIHRFTIDYSKFIIISGIVSSPGIVYKQVVQSSVTHILLKTELLLMLAYYHA